MAVRSKKPHDEKIIIRNISLVSIIGNCVLSAFKLFAGIFGSSGAMISDAIHSLSDVATTIIALIGINLSKQDADKEHPYGHERFESIASLILGILLLITGLGIGKTGLEHILSGQYAQLEAPKAIALIAAIASIVTKEAMYWYTRHYAKILNSSVFMADAWHHRSDAMSSVGSLIGIAGAMMGFPVMDSIASVVICIFIIKVAFDILKNAVKNMLDTSCGEDYEKNLREYILKQEGVAGIDMLHTRMFGSKVYIDLEISVDANKTFREAHAISERVHDGVEKDFPDIKHIMIHVNPV
ncbi:MAG: cation transporter [Eubacterium sp.]|nr:cation transporter [Eubacterium sp.]